MPRKSKIVSTVVLLTSVLGTSLLVGEIHSAAAQPVAAPVAKQASAIAKPVATKSLDSKAPSSNFEAIDEVNVTQNGEQTEVNVVGSTKLTYHVVSLHSPDRIVLDFEGALLKTSEHNIASNLGAVKEVRLAQFTPEATRVVIDLRKPAHYKINASGNAITVEFTAEASGGAAGGTIKSPSSAVAKPSEVTTNKVSIPQGALDNVPAPVAVLPSALTQTSGALATPADVEPLHPAEMPAAKQVAASAAATSSNSARTGYDETSEPTVSTPATILAQETQSSGKSSQSTAPAPATSPTPSASPATAQPDGRIPTPFGPMNSPSSPPSKPTEQSTPPPQQAKPTTQAPGAAGSDQQTPAPPKAADANSSKEPSGSPSGSPAAAGSQPGLSGANQGGGAVSLNLENADLYQVLRIIGTELKINYVVDPAVKGTVTINTAGAVSRADLFSVLESILQVNGAAIVKGDGYYRVVPIADAKLSALPLEFAKAPEAASSPGETLVLQIFPMRFVPATEMGKVLAPFVTPAGEIVVAEHANVLLVVETPAKLRQIGGIIDMFDSPTFSRQRVRLFPVVNNSAKSVITELQSVFGGYALSTSSAIRFVAIDSLNAILAISPAPEVFSDIEEWVNRLDRPPQDVGVQNFVYLVQNTKAADLRDILIELYGGDVPRPQSLPAPSTPPNPLIPPAALEEQQRALLPPAPERVQGRIRIISDDKNNALIVQASPHDYDILKRTLTQLDILPRQVFIDAKIYEVDLTGDLSFGVSAFLQNNSSLTSPPSTIGSFSPGQSGGSFQAQTFAIIGATRTLQLFLNATENRSRVRMLSAPSILVTDNTGARIQVGAQVPVPIGSALTPIQAGGTSVFAQTIQYVDTGVILTVTPHVNASGIVLLSVSQEVSAAVPNTTSQIVAPVINKNSFQTQVVLSDGEPLGLGGIIQTSVSYSRDRIPILGDIPFFGALFGNTTKNTSRTEIVLLLTPHVLQNTPAAAASTEEFLDRMRETKKAMEQLK